MPTLHVLGTAGYHPSDTRETVSILIPEYGFVLDAGSGFYRARGRITTPHLSIFLSHLHLDHSIGTTFLVDVLWGTDVKDVVILGLREHLVYLKDRLFGSPLFPLKFAEVPLAYALHPLDGGEHFSHRGVSVRTQKLIHPGSSLGYRFEFPDGKTLSYVTDTTQSDTYIELINNSDVLIHECNFPDGWEKHAKKTGHSWTSGVARLAKKANVKKLLLIHFNPLDPLRDPTHQDNAEEVFPHTIIAEDNMKIVF